MTRKLRGFRQLEALESKALLGSVPIVSLPHATVVLVAATSVSVTPTNVSLAPGGVNGTVFGTFGRTARSVVVHAQGNAVLLGHVNVKGEIALSGPKSNMLAVGLLTLTGRQGSLQIQVEAENAVMTPLGLTASTTETVVEATGSGTAIQGETGNGSLELGQGTRPFHVPGGSVPAHKWFSLNFTLNPPTA
jgi:hypothetical protein